MQEDGLVMVDAAAGIARRGRDRRSGEKRNSVLWIALGVNLAGTSRAKSL